MAEAETAAGKEDENGRVRGNWRQLTNAEQTRGSSHQREVNTVDLERILFAGHKNVRGKEI